MRRKSDPDVAERGGFVQPLTFGGVAALSSVSWTRLFIMQGIVAAIAAAVTVWFVVIAWDPIVRSAIERLPDDAEIRGGSLIWNGPDTLSLTDGKSKFLSFEVDLADGADTGALADLQFEFARTELRMRSILGYLPVPYPTGWLIGLNRLELEPWWGAWRPAVFAGVATAMIVGLFVSWASLATIYCVPVWAVAFYADRQLSWPGAWKLCSAALMPGALFLTIAVAAYALQQIAILQLMLALVLHFVIAWIYLVFAPFYLPRVRPKFRKNPFSGR